MITEADISEAFAARASRVPSPAVRRLQGTDYAPRTRRVRPPLAFGALAGAGSATAVVLSIVGLGTSAPNAFAGWTRTPTHATRAQAAHADVSCQARTSGLPPAVKPSAPGLRPVLDDARGPFTVVIYSNGDAVMTCITSPTFTSVSGSVGPGASNVAPGQIQLMSEHSTTRDGQAFTIVEGHAGQDVSAATLMLDDGQIIKATIENGWFTAWWPGTHDATDAILTTPSGTSSQRLSPGARECGSTPCHAAGYTSVKGGPRSGASANSQGYPSTP